MAFKMKGNPYKMGKIATKSTMAKMKTSYKMKEAMAKMKSPMELKKDSPMDKYKSDAQRKAVHASKAERGMTMKSPMEAAKPDYIDLDGDENKTESMKKAAADKKSATKMKPGRSRSKADKKQFADVGPRKASMSEAMAAGATTAAASKKADKNQAKATKTEVELGSMLSKSKKKSSRSKSVGGGMEKKSPVPIVRESTSITADPQNKRTKKQSKKVKKAADKEQKRNLEVYGEEGSTTGILPGKYGKRQLKNMSNKERDRLVKLYTDFENTGDEETYYSTSQRKRVKTPKTGALSNLTRKQRAKKDAYILEMRKKENKALAKRNPKSHEANIKTKERLRREKPTNEQLLGKLDQQFDHNKPKT